MLGNWVSAPPPGDFSPQAALVLGINQLLPYYPHIAVSVVRPLIDRIALVGVVLGEEQRRMVITVLSDWGLPAHLIHFVSMPVKGMWVRDYGPMFVRRSDGSVVLLDAEYSMAERPEDDRASAILGELLHLPTCRAPLSMEGGNLLSNGRGFCLSTGKLAAMNLGRGYSQEKVLEILDDYYGISARFNLPHVPGEKTGHADVIATFTAPDVVVLAAYDPATDPEASRMLDKAGEALSGVEVGGQRLRVARVKSPSMRDGICRSYTNVIYANGVLLVPMYPDVAIDLDQEALSLYSDLLPGWDIVGVDVSGMIHLGGALRCLSLNVPWLYDRFSLPSSASPRGGVDAPTYYRPARSRSSGGPSSAGLR